MGTCLLVRQQQGRRGGPLRSQPVDESAVAVREGENRKCARIVYTHTHTLSCFPSCSLSLSLSVAQAFTISSASSSSSTSGRRRLRSRAVSFSPKTRSAYFTCKICFNYILLFLSVLIIVFSHVLILRSFSHISTVRKKKSRRNFHL